MTSQNRGLEFALLLTLPAAVALFVIAEPVITVLFERGAFSAADSQATAWALMAYATGLPAYVLIRVLTPGFFAREDTSTPVKIAAAGIVINIALNLILMRVWGHVGIAIAASISAWINALALGVVLRRRDQLTLDKRLAKRWPRIIAASLVMGSALYGAEVVLTPWLSGDEMVRMLTLAGLVIGGSAVFGLAVQIFGAAHLRDLKGLLRGGSKAA